MTSALYLGSEGDQHPWSYSKQLAIASHAIAYQHTPLRHSIDAILHDKPLGHSASPRPTLPHIETLRRRVVTVLPRPLLPGTRLSPVDALSRGTGSCEERGANISPQSSSDSSDEDSDVVVDDEENDPHSSEIQPKENHLTFDPAQQLQISNPISSRKGENLKVAAAEVHVKNSAEKVKSAFRPIVRPWLAGDESKGGTERALSKPASSKDRFRAVGLLQTKWPASGPRSLDAVSMLRRHSSAFRLACRPDIKQPRHAMVSIASSPFQRTAEAGQPLPSSLSSWFSWLRSGGLHLGTHPSPPEQFHPEVQTCRGVLPPSNLPTVTSAQQAPRYNCEDCGKSYSTFGGLSKHKQFHCAAQIKKDFRCKFCDKSYSSLGALKMHIRTHTLPCKCGVCGKAFSRPWLLQGHLRTHTGEKPFSCPHCARAFADRSNLRAHLQTHSDVKKYSCRHCSKTFSRMSLLVKHKESSCIALHR